MVERAALAGGRGAQRVSECSHADALLLVVCMAVHVGGPKGLGDILSSSGSKSLPIFLTLGILNAEPKVYTTHAVFLSRQRLRCKGCNWFGFRLTSLTS